MVCKVMKAFVVAVLTRSVEVDGLRIKRVEMFGCGKCTHRYEDDLEEVRETQKAQKTQKKKPREIVNTMRFKTRKPEVPEESKDLEKPDSKVQDKVEKKEAPQSTRQKKSYPEYSARAAKNAEKYFLNQRREMAPAYDLHEIDMNTASAIVSGGMMTPALFAPPKKSNLEVTTKDKVKSFGEKAGIMGGQKVVNDLISHAGGQAGPPIKTMVVNTGMNVEDIMRTINLQDEYSNLKFNSGKLG